MHRQERKELDTHRGVSHVERRPGLAQVHVNLDRSRLSQARLDVMQAIADDGMTLNFVKLTPAGISFLVREETQKQIGDLLTRLQLPFEVIGRRSVVIAHAPNMREDQGLIARIIRTTIESGVRIDQVGDMHDRVLVMVPSEEAEHLESLLEQRLVGTTH